MKVKINRTVCKAILVLLVFLLLGGFLFFLLSHWEAGHGLSMSLDSEEKGRIYLNDTYYVPNNKVEATLFIGVDKFDTQMQESSYNNNQQADFLMLLLLDKRTETYTALHLNRDTMTEIPVLGVRGEKAGSITGQLALAHTYGSGGTDSCRNTVDAVSNFLYGVKIDHYVAFTMDAVTQLNDLVDGVTVTMLDDMSTISPDMKKGASVTLSGEEALSYVRARQGLEDSTNLHRMERQRQYLTELQKALIAKQEADPDFPMKALNAISVHMTSDCSGNQLAKMAERLESYTDTGFVSLDGEAVTGSEFMEFYADETALKQLVVQLFYVPDKQ